MEKQNRDNDVPRWVKIAIGTLAVLLVGPIVGSFLVVFALIAGPFLLATVAEQATARGDPDGRPHQHRPGSPRGRAIPIPLGRVGAHAH